MEKFVEQTLLYDFYGELLTGHQRRIYEAAVFEDLSLSEIARDEGISRQGVHDLIRRCGRILVGYEERLHLVERFLKIREKVGQIKALTADDAAGSPQERRISVAQIAAEILEEL